MATVSQVSWLVSNVATQNDITTITSNINTLLTRTDCSTPANSELCTYLNSINTTANIIYSEMATSEQCSDILNDVTWLKNNVATSSAMANNFTDIKNMLTGMDADLLTVSNDLSLINTSLSGQMSNSQDDITWIKNNVATSEEMANNFTETLSRLSQINTTLSDTNTYLHSDIANKLTEINTTTENNYEYLQNTIYTKLNETWDSTQQTLIYIGNPADDESQNTLFGGYQYTQNRITEINGNLTELKTLTENINLTAQTINSTINSILLEVDDLEELHQCSPTPTSTICALINDIKTETENIYTLAIEINQTTQNISQSQSSDFHIRLSDFGEVSADSDFLLKVWVTNYLQQPKDTDTIPTVILYDPVRNAIGPLTMNKDETGIYSLNYTTTSSQTDGTWEAVVTTVVNGVSNRYSDYWELESSPCEVKISSISDKTIPTITAETKITNEGSGANEYQYEYCIVSSQDNSCGGNDDECYGSGAKLIQPGDSWNTQLTCDEITQTGDYWFKVLVYYGTEVSGSSKSFTAVQDPGDSDSGESSGGTSGAGGTSVAETTITPEITTGEKIGKLQIVDYPEFIELKINETIVKEIEIKNIGDDTLHNVRITISGLPSSLYLINPKTINIESGKTEIFIIRIKPSFEEKQYPIKFIITSDEDAKEETSFLNIAREIRPSLFVQLSRIKLSTLILIIAIAIILGLLIFILIRERKLKKELEKIKKKKK